MTERYNVSNNGMGEYNLVFDMESFQSYPEDSSRIQEVSWRNLNYFVKISRKEKRQVLFDLNGSFLFGQMTAIMGPSGSGKTTLLECLINKREHGLSGKIGIRGLLNAKVAIIPQENSFLPEFTVKQTLLFASKIKNTGKKHTQIIENVAKLLGLVDCLENNVKKCSGGQLKRLAIAQELVSETNILILDEPTSGLDSSTCYQVMSALKNLAKSSSLEKPIAILTTIHQPGSKVFNMFDKVYALSKTGRCIFEGAPEDVTKQTSNMGLDCPINYNPAEYLLEICYGDHGEQKINDLSEAHNLRYESTNDPPNTKVSNEKNGKFFVINILHIYYLWQRALKALTFNWLVLSLQIGTYTTSPVMISLLYNYKIGSYVGCPSKMSESDMNEQIAEIKAINDNYAFLFFAFLLFMMGAMMVAVLTFPLEMNVIRNEWRNGWYKCWTYFIGRSLADLPFQIIFPFVFCAIAYYMTGQVNDIWRYIVYSLFMVTVSFCAQSQGLIFGAIFMNELAAAVFISVTSTVPIMLFGGYFIRIAAMPKWASWLSYISYFRYTYQAILVTIYGFDRCICNNMTTTPAYNFSTSDFNNTNMKIFSNNQGDCHSYPITDFNLNDDVLWKSIIGISVYFIIIRSITFLIVLFKLSRRT